MKDIIFPILLGASIYPFRQMFGVKVGIKYRLFESFAILLVSGPVAWLFNFKYSEQETTIEIVRFASLLLIGILVGVLLTRKLIADHHI